MSFDSLLTHRLVVERPMTTLNPDGSVAEDEMGDPVRTWDVLATVQASVQPALARDVIMREIATIHGAGADVGDYRIYLRPLDITTADRLYYEDIADWQLIGIYSADPNLRLELVSIRNAAGRNHHLECDARIISAPAEQTGS